MTITPETLAELRALAAAAVERAQHVDPEMGPCSMTCMHNAAYTVAIAEAGPALLGEIERLRADLARVSAEMGLPPTIGPAPGEIERTMREHAETRAQLAALREAASASAAATWAVLCEYGSDGQPILIRMAKECDALRTALADTRAAAEAHDEEVRGAMAAEVAGLLTGRPGDTSAITEPTARVLAAIKKRDAEVLREAVEAAREHAETAAARALTTLDAVTLLQRLRALASRERGQ